MSNDTWCLLCRKRCGNAHIFNNILISILIIEVIAVIVFATT